MQKAIQQYVLANWGKLFPGMPAPKMLATLQISQSHEKEDKFGRIAHLLFVEGSSSPVIVAKFCKARGYEYSLEREAVFLKELENSVISGNVPKILDGTTINGRLVVFEEAVPGTPFSVLAKKAYHSLSSEAFKEVVAGHMDMASVFLASLKETTRTKGSGTARAEIEHVITEYSDRLELAGTEKNLVYGLARAVEGFIDDGSPATLVHTDFILSNVFRFEDGEIKVIDWEFASRCRLGFLDTMRFIYHYYIILKELGALGEDSFHETFINQSNWFSSLSLEFAMKVEGEKIKNAADLRTLFSFFLIFEVCLQSRVNMVWKAVYMGYHRELVNNLTGYSSMKEREDLVREKNELLAMNNGLRAENESMRNNYDHTIAGLNKTIETFVNSKSWRITYPIRWVSARLKGLND